MWRRLGTLLALAVVLAGCGGDDDGAEAPKRERPRIDFNSPPSPRGGAGGFDARLVADGFEEPLLVVPGPDGLLVLERKGLVKTVPDGDVFLDLRRHVGTKGPEQGLLSLISRGGRWWAYFTDRGDDIRLAEVEPGRGVTRTVLRIEHPTEPPPGTPETGEDLRVHNGGAMAFGPDGLLYLGVGDGGGQKDPADRGQDRDVLLGKILRLDVRRRRPRPEIYALGLRNPYRFTFAPNGDLVIGDVGQHEVEEIDVIPRGREGANLGWSCFEGNRRLKDCEVPDMLGPVIERPSSRYQRPCASITGGVVLDDGRYLYSDFCNGELRTARLRGTEPAADDRGTGFTIPWPSSFAQIDGRVYVTSYYRGEVYEVLID